MGVVSEISDRVLVMYAGHAVEHAPKTELLRRPRHPYTWGLLGSVPRVTGPRVSRLPAIPGMAPSLVDGDEGCAFAPRCAHRFAPCGERPPLRGSNGHLDACWLPDDRTALRP